MCLTTKRSIHLIAQQDIECYKVMFYYPISEQLVPFFQQSYTYQIGELYKADGEHTLMHHKKSYRLLSGFFHSYINKKEALKFYNAWEDIYACVYLIKCIIPNGTIYYKGKNNDSVANYASEKIIFKEIINV